MWLFLRSMRSTLIIATAIPVSLMGAFAVMYFAGYTLNSITMLALLLLIGVVVDDAIVVLENIFRHREEIDTDPVTAAVNGSREVVFAVIAATLSLVSIFAPVMFLGGIIGQFFKSFAVVVTFGVLVSLFVSLTLTPMLCSRYLKVEKQHGGCITSLDRFFHGMDNLLPLPARQGAASPLEGGGVDPGDRGGEQLFLHQRGQDFRPRRGRRPLPGEPAYPARFQHRIHRQPFAHGRGTAVPPQGNRHRIRPDRPRQCGAGQPGDGGGAHGAARRTQNQAAGRDSRDPQGAGANSRCARFRRALSDGRRPARRAACSS